MIYLFQKNTLIAALSKITYTGNPRIHTAALAQKEKPNICQGEPSLQNALETAKKSLRQVHFLIIMYEILNVLPQSSPN